METKWQTLNKTLEWTRSIKMEKGCAWLYGVKPQYYRFAGQKDEAAAALETARKDALEKGADSLRILWQGGGDFLNLRPAGNSWYEMPLKEDCPLLPLKMNAAYRYGEMTPWGGDQLRDVFGKPIPDERTGEGLEMSVIPGLESATENGESLSSLIAREGRRLTGLEEGAAFPLLLKLLAAKGSLSVQVHPDDEYAAKNEGKLGKTEAWVILEAEENASILYGIKEGVTLAQLEKGLLSGEDIEPMIQRVPVKSGDVFFMPAGMVHAIGGGILLYEIQQSSDVTYRLWDFNRVNEKGEKRPLHIRQSLDVICPELKGQKAKMPEMLDDQLHALLRVPAFHLDCACLKKEMALPGCDGFRVLTALDPMTLCYDGAEMELAAGDTAFLPAASPALRLKGEGRALLSAEKM